MFLSFDQKEWWVDKIRMFVASIDEVVYKLIGWIFEGIFSIANLSVNSDLTIMIYKRVYILLGVYMIFKLSFSFIKYMVSPDSMNDKEQGTAKLVVRIITMLGILILLPTIFFEDELLGRVDVKNPDTGAVENVPRGPILNVLQNGVIKTLPKIILGRDDNFDEEGSVQSKASEYGEKLAVMMLGTFYYPKECASIEDGGEGDCGDKQQISTLSNFRTSIISSDPLSSYYDYHYMWPLSLVVGVAMVVILLGIIVDIAVRVFKMMILQMIAPIPVLSYIDPKSSKDGAFNSWLKTFVSTYLDIFIKLLSVYLILLLCSEMMKTDGLFDKSVMGSVGSTSSFVLVFLIIGLFKFAKDIPKFIKSVLGMKDTGGDGLFGGLKTLGTAAGLVGGAALGLAAGTVGKGAAIAASVQKAKADGKGKRAVAWAGIKSGLGMGGSMLSGLVRGGSQGFKGAAKGNPLSGFSHAISAQTSANQRNLASAMSGSTMLGRLGTRASGFFTGQTAAERDEQTLQDYKDIKDSSNEIKDLLSDSASKTRAEYAMTVGSPGHEREMADFNLSKFNTTLQLAASGNATAMGTLGSVYGYSSVGAAQQDSFRLKKQFEASHYGAIMNGEINDKDALAIRAATEITEQNLRNTNINDASGNRITSVAKKDADGNVTDLNFGEISAASSREINNLKSSQKYKSNKANAAATKKSGK